MSSRIRPMAAADIEDVTRLCVELGYTMDSDEVAARFALVSVRADHAALVAEDGGEVIAWVHVHSSLLLQSPPAAEIGGVVVAKARRGEGWGRRLMEAAEDWARDHGFEEVRLRSNELREESHDFYRAVGYDNLKTSQTYIKGLGLS